METIYINDKTYKGERIFENNKVCIYLINRMKDKYLVLCNKDGLIQDMIITGSKKIYKLLDLICNSNEEEIKMQIQEKVNQIKSESYNKKLKIIDLEKYRRKIVNLYDKNYPSFVLLGIKLPELLSITN